MGNECFNQTLHSRYSDQLTAVNLPELKDCWTTVEVYKIKSLFQKASEKNTLTPKNDSLPYEKFVELFPEIARYPERQKRRIFQIFNPEGLQSVDWHSFLSSISMCYFAKEAVLATLMFMIFDETLSKSLSRPELELLCELNHQYSCTSDSQGEEVPIYFPDEIVTALLRGDALSYGQWMSEYGTYFNMVKFRRLFNIFPSEAIEKELVRNFHSYNHLLHEEEQRYVSYLVDFKWFEAWKLYVKQQYGCTLDTNSSKPVTFRTKKMITSSNKSAAQIAESLTMRQLKFSGSEGKNQTHEDSHARNFDFVHSNIGEKPKSITNKALEGDYEQVLRHDLIENRDYVLVSQKVWEKLKKIYDGYPEFRRTGFDFIELYPKVIRVFPYSRGQLFYQQENVKEVTAYYPIEGILSALLPKDDSLAGYKFYYKAVGMQRWEIIPDLGMVLAELTPEVYVYIVRVPEKDVETFEKKFLKAPRNISEINVGDEIMFTHPWRKIEQRMVYIGKNLEGKCILHRPGEPYIYNICVMEQDLLQKGKYLPVEEPSGGLNPIKSKAKDSSEYVGIPSTRGLGYVSSVIMHLYYDWAFRQQLLLLETENKEAGNLIERVSCIFKCLAQKKPVQADALIQLIEQDMPEFSQLCVQTCNSFYHSFIKAIHQDLKQSKMKDTLRDHLICSQKVTTCKKCQGITTKSEQKYALELPLRQSRQKYYEVVYVPYNESLNQAEAQLLKYCFKLRPNATFKEYKDAFEIVAGLKGKDKKYLLVQVYANNIVKNYSTAKEHATLNEIYLRDTDSIVAYELKVDFTTFVEKHYKVKKQLEPKDIKVDQFIDCMNPTKGWIFGKVSDKVSSPYGVKNVVEVVHKFNKGEQWQVCYEIDEEVIASFPTRSHLNGENYHLRLQQRYFNEASNDMEICNLPLVTVLSNWMRWKEFNYLIFLQVRKFVSDQVLEGVFGEDPADQQFDFHSSKSIASSMNLKRSQKGRANKLKQFLRSSSLPYRISLVDYTGRCAVCFKQMKSRIFPGEDRKKFCTGCELSHIEPLAWQIKVSDVMICLDWKSLDLMKKDVVRSHSSHANMMAEKKADYNNLSDCLSNLATGHTESLEQLCCNVQTEVLVREKILTAPINLTIYLERIVEENGIIKILPDQVKCDETLEIKGAKYRLVGATSIEGGTNKSTKFRSFVRIRDDEWVEYDGTVVRMVRKNAIDKFALLNVFYKRIEQ